MIKVNSKRGRVELDGDSLARAIDAYLEAHQVYVGGARTIYIDGSLIRDTSATVIAEGRCHVNTREVVQEVKDSALPLSAEEPDTVLYDAEMLSVLTRWREKEDAADDELIDAWRQWRSKHEGGR